MAKKSKEHLITEAAEVHSNLNAFSIVVALLEGGHVTAPSYRAAARIIKICKDEQQRCLRRYDRIADRIVRG
jgi:hypothetical protein